MSNTESRENSIFVESLTDNEIEPCIERYPWVTIGNTIGILAFMSLMCGAVITGYGITDIWEASHDQLLHRISIRLDPIILKTKNPNFDGGKSNYLPIWYGASVAGVVSGLIQFITSIWFILNACTERKLNYKAKVWMLSQLIVSFMLLIIIGGVFIAGFEPDSMICSFGIDFIIINIFMFLSMPIIRKLEKPPKTSGQIHFHGIGGGKESSIFTPLLLL